VPKENLQYINIQQNNKQLKINSQIITNDNIFESEDSFLLLGNTIPSDAVNQINILKKNTPKTYIATICESINQQIILLDDFIGIEDKTRKLDDIYGVAIPQDDLKMEAKYFKDINPDYTFSPFHLLYRHVIKNITNTISLNILIINNNMYALILDNEQKIVYGAIKKISNLDKVQIDEFSNKYKEHFDDKEFIKQINQLEIQNNITTIINEFYQENPKNYFCEEVCILFTFDSLDNDQINSMQNTLMLDVKCHRFNLHKYMFELSKTPYVAKTNFSIPYDKSKKHFLINIAISFIVLTCFIIGISIYTQKMEVVVDTSPLNTIKEDKVIDVKPLKKTEHTKAVPQKIIKDNQIKLPDHKLINKYISQLMHSIFDTIPSNAVLEEVQIEEQDSTLACSLLDMKSFKDHIQVKLLKLYKMSEILLADENQQIFNVIIKNSNLISNNSLARNIEKIIYKKEQSVIEEDVLIKQIDKLLPNGTQASFTSKLKNKFLTYNFYILTVFEKPKDLFNFIDSLNKQTYSIHIKYPIELIQTAKGLEATFNLQVHQLYKNAL